MIAAATATATPVLRGVAAAASVAGILLGFLSTYALDRVFDTPLVVRGLIFAAALIGCGLVPLAIERWVIRRRRPDQLARLLSQTRPEVGGQLLGVIELSEDDHEQARSPELVAAAIKQVSDSVVRQDLKDAIPKPRHKQYAIAAGSLAGVASLLLVGTTAAAKNTWARFLTPWLSTPRYTFAAARPLPARIVVPHGESFDVTVRHLGNAAHRDLRSR